MRRAPAAAPPHPAWDARSAALLPTLTRRALTAMRLAPAARSAWIRLYPLPRATEELLVDEVQRSWDGVPLPASLDRLLDAARRAELDRLADALHAACDGPERAGEHVSVDSLQALDEALGQGRAAMVLTASLGPWQSLAPALARRGYKVALLDLRAPEDRPGPGLPAAPGLDLVRLPASGSARPLVRFAMRDGAVIVALADAGRSPRIAHGGLLGRVARVPSTPFELARRAELSVLPAFTIREHGATRLRFDKEMRIDDSGSDADLDANASRFLKVVERFARRHPDLYLGHLLARRLAASTEPVPFFEDQRPA